MNDVSGLSAAFVESHPADAARVLEGVAAPDTAAFVAALTARQAAPILREMNPAYCARVLDSLDSGQIAGLARLMGPQAAARMLDSLPHQRQLEVLAQLPVATAVAIRMLIGYPRGTCGACMDPWTLALDAEMAAEDALAQVRAFDGQLGDCLFVTNGHRRLRGLLTFDALVRAAPRAALAALMRPPPHAFPALTSVASAAGHAAWAEFHVLPVVERENRLVGALHRRSLAAALDDGSISQDAAVADGLFGAYWQMFSALSGAVVGALPGVGPVARRKGGDGN